MAHDITSHILRVVFLPDFVTSTVTPAIHGKVLEAFRMSNKGYRPVFKTAMSIACTHTVEQFKYVIEIHQHTIKPPPLKFSLSVHVTVSRDAKQASDSLIVLAL